MECVECEEDHCVCEDENVRRGILTSILEMMNDKVITYRNVMQNRVLMIKEDIVTTITEETMKFQEMINSNLMKLDTIMSTISEGDEEVVISEDMMEAMTFSIDIDLDSENIQIAFNKAIMGEFVIFRDMIKKKKESEKEKEKQKASSEEIE